MPKTLRSNQSGFGTLLIILLVVAISGVVIVAFQVAQSQKKNAVAVTSGQTSNKKPTQSSPAATATPTPTPAASQPTPTPKPAAATPTPRPSTPNITAVDASGCSGYITAYGALSTGTPYYQNYTAAYTGGTVIATIAYGGAVQVKCEDNGIALALHNGTSGAVRVSQLSGTRP
ncbi:MAG TPA: hypothetical protein VLI05_02720 [Candidatus Saccharimonadia bacterium]|nr:hypothetical protein [Candidatus Saccharimonadia bacterium]